jgi:hypothetical protein
MAYPYATANDSATVTGYTRCVFLQAYGGTPTGTDAGSLGGSGGSLTGSRTGQHTGFKPGDIVFLRNATATRLAGTAPPIVATSAYAEATRSVVDDL